MNRPCRSSQPPASRKPSAVPLTSTFASSFSPTTTVAWVLAMGAMATGSVVLATSAW